MPETSPAILRIYAGNIWSGAYNNDQIADQLRCAADEIDHLRECVRKDRLVQINLGLKATNQIRNRFFLNFSPAADEIYRLCNEIDRRQTSETSLRQALEFRVTAARLQGEELFRLRKGLEALAELPREDEDVTRLARFILEGGHVEHCRFCGSKEDVSVEHHHSYGRTPVCDRCLEWNADERVTR